MKHVPLDQLEFTTFKTLVNSRFSVVVDPDKTVALELIEANLTGESGPDAARRSPYESFSLVFVGPAGAPLSQKTHRFEHDTIGQFDLFIVPVAAERDSIRYQAVFNRLRQRH